MSQRRTRFTVHIRRPDGEIIKQVILAYSAESARVYYARRHDVVRVERGDYRQRARNAAIRANGGYRLDPRALRDAIALLGLRIPVKIRYTSRVGATNGNYCFKGTHHDIMLKSYHTAAQATETLWHELTHAMQAERAGGTTETWADVRREQARYAYRRRPIEVEARAMSAKMSPTHPLAR